MAAPAVAVVGALAATPQVRALVTPAPAAAAGHLATARAGAPSQAASMQASGAASARGEAHGYQRAKAAGASTSITSTPTPAAHKSSSAPTPTPTPSATPTPTPASDPGSTAPTSGRSTPDCSGSSGMLPANYAQIVDFLTAHGYTGIAAAGIAGNIYQESGGNPESAGDGGGGLIGWTPLPAGLVTGDPATDLETQLEAVLTFDQQWSQYLPALNAAASPAAAADIYVTDFERAGIPAAGTREASADAVAAACKI
jgi:hypothetical protein